MNISETLIEQFFRGVCNEEEKEAVMAYFKNNPDKWVQYVTPESWQQFQVTGSLPPAVSDKMLHAIEAHMERQRNVKVMVRRALVAAAVLMPLMIGVFLYMREKQPAGNGLAIQTGGVREDSVFVEKRNATKKSIAFVLADGSKITLEPESEVKYSKSFGTKDRVVYLTGQALFSVAGNRKVPFIVHAGGLATTVLGTVFTMTAWSDNAKTVRVHLLSGKVMVKPDSLLLNDNRIATYLQPGQELQYNPVKKLITVNNISEQPLKIKGAGTIDMPVRKMPEVLVFNDEPLARVFSSMEVKCGIRFVYNKSILAERNFTGSFTPGKDSLSVFLSDIAALNNLNIHKKENVVYITQ